MQKTVSIDEKNVWPFFKNPSKNVFICSIAITELVQVHHFYNCWLVKSDKSLDVGLVLRQTCRAHHPNWDVERWVELGLSLCFNSITSSIAQY